MGSVTKFCVDFIKVDFTDRECVPRVVEIIFEEVKISMINFIHQMHREIIIVIHNWMGPLCSVAFLLVETRDLFQIYSMFCLD
jgi:predicted protein tyrosine phosphatase